MGSVLRPRDASPWQPPRRRPGRRFRCGRRKAGSLEVWACVEKNLWAEASRREGKSDVIRFPAPVQFMPWFSFLNLTQRAATKTPYGSCYLDGLQAKAKKQNRRKHICAVWRPRRTEQHAERIIDSDNLRIQWPSRLSLSPTHPLHLFTSCGAPGMVSALPAQFWCLEYSDYYLCGVAGQGDRYMLLHSQHLRTFCGLFHTF